MQNMLTSANSCKVYSLIPWAEYFGGSSGYFFHLYLSFSPFVSTHSPIHYLLWKHLLNTLPAFLHTASKRIISVDSHWKRWAVPWRNVWVVLCCKGWASGEQLALALTPALHTAQTLLRPDSIKACHCEGRESPLESGHPAVKIPKIRVITLSVYYQVLIKAFIHLWK